MVLLSAVLFAVSGMGAGLSDSLLMFILFRLVGGLGVAPGANIGEQAAVFEPVHGSAPKYAGQNKANPTALILSAALMLRHLGETSAADAVEEATRAVIAEGQTTTYDLGGRAGTREFGEAVASRVHAAV